jgi:microcystin-dependent protein
MPLETATYIDDLVATNPAAADGLSQADDHLRLIKSTLQATFPNVTGAVSATNAQLNAQYPVGTVSMWPATAVPTAHLALTGQAISRATYSVLFGVLGTTHGVGDGATTFNLPDTRGRSIFGYDAAASAGRLTTAVASIDSGTMGAAGGAQSYTLAETNLPGHTHSLTVSGSATTATESNGHTHSGTSGQESGDHLHSGTTLVESNTHTHGGTTGVESNDHEHTATVTDPGHTHTASTTGQVATGGGSGDDGGAGNSTPAGTVTVNSSTTGITVAISGRNVTHTHNFTSGNNSASHTHDFVTGGVSGAHTHDITTGTVSATHTHTVTVNSTGTSGSTGSGTAKTYMPPALVLQFIIYTGVP